MHEKIYLWKEDAPYTQFLPCRPSPPSRNTPFPAPGARWWWCPAAAIA